MTSNDNNDEIRFTLDAPPDKLERMTLELEDAPTYRMKLPPSGRTGRVFVVGHADEIDDGGGVSTTTTIMTKSLYRKLAERSAGNSAPVDSRYELHEVLGEGGTGIVYEMTDHNVGRKVAVKVLKGAESDGERQSFIEEGQVAAKLEHPNIIPVYDMDVDDSGHVFITMKDVKGDTLKSYIDGDMTLDMEEIILTFLKVCDAVGYAHGNGMTHQDIKPENVMIGEYGEVFLIDWGAAILQSDEVQLSPVYMSPQQAAGETPSAADDVYCLGSSLFHVLTKRFPTNASTIKELWDKKVAGDVDLPTAKEKRTIPGPLLAIALKAMEKDPAQRYQSVKAFADDLKAYQSGFPTDAEDAGLFTVLELLIKRRFREATVVLTAIVLLAVTGVTYYLQSQRTKNALVEAELKAYRLAEVAEEMAEERKDHWDLVVSQDFSGTATMDPRLSVAEGGMKNGGLYLMYQSPVSEVKVDEPLEGELKLELNFTCPTVPSFDIGFVEEDHENTRYFNVGGEALMVSYFNGYRKRYSSPAKIREIIEVDKVNTLQIWRQNNVWHLTLNGVKLIKYYDPDLKTGVFKTEPRISRHTIFGELKLISLKIWNRQPADYVPVLEQGRLLHQMGMNEKARDWFLAHGKKLQNEKLQYEAAFFAASIDAGQGIDQQIEELDAVAKGPNNPFRYAAMHRVTQFAAKRGRLKEAFQFLLRATREAPELHTYWAVWPLLEDYVCNLPESEKNRAFRQLAELPLASIDFKSDKIDDITFLKHCKAPTIGLQGSGVTDISPLKGLPIQDLNLQSPGVTDLSALRGMKLRELAINKADITDLSPLEGMRLDILAAKRIPSLDLSTIKNLQVSKLILDGSTLKNPDAISRTGAKLIRLSNCNLKDLDFVQTLEPVELIAWVNDISDISGLANKDLAVLQLSVNSITDIAPLASAKVTGRLGLSSNPLSDISPLKGYPVRQFNLSNTKVRDLSVLRTMPNLREFILTGPFAWDIKHGKRYLVPPDLTTIGALKLDVLSLENAGIKDVTPLKECQISGSLNLSKNPITDLSPLTGQKVKQLILSNVPVTDLKPIASMNALETLYLSRTSDSGIEGVPELSHLAGTKLKNLNLSGIPLTDLTPLRDCKELRHILLKDCPVTDISPLADLPIYDFRLEGTNVTDLSVFWGRDLPFGIFVLSGTPEKPGALSDLRPLAGTSIVYLHLNHQTISDLSPLTGCSLTGSLELRGNPITDITALKGKDITSLDISETQVTNITVIKTMKKLRKLKVKGLTLDEESEKLLKSMLHIELRR